MAFDIAKALKHRVIFLSGDEELLRRRAMQELLGAAGVDEDGFDTEVFDAGSSSPTAWLASCGTAPFLGDRRIAVVRHLLRYELDRGKSEAEKGKTDNHKSLIESLKNLPDTALVVLVGDDESGDDMKQAKVGKNRAAWERVVKAGSGLVESFTVDSKNLLGLLKQEFAKADRKISGAALETLAEMCGGSLTRCYEEMEKLLIYTEGSPSIQESDVKNLVVPSREWNVFKLVDAIIAGQVGDSLKQIRTLVGSQNKAEDIAMRNIFPALSRHLKLLWQGRLYLDARCSPGSANPEVLSRLPEKPNINSEKDWIQRKTLAAARNTTFKQLSSAFEVLAVTDARMKGIEPGFSGIDSLEVMTLKLVEVFKTG